MMKKLIFSLAAILWGLTALAQSNTLSIDEHNKYVYYQVVETPGIPVDSLQKRAKYFIDITPGIKTEKAAVAGIITAKGKFLTYAGFSMLKHENGKVSYTLHIEYKDQKYRFWFTDFVFTPYMRDRYNNYVPITGTEVVFEKVQAKFGKKIFTDAAAQTAENCRQLGESLKWRMKNVLAFKEERKPAKVAIDKW